MARNQEKVDQMIDDFAREIGDAYGEGAEDDQGDKIAQSQDFAPQHVGGRMSFRPGNTVSLSHDSDNVDTYSPDLKDNQSRVIPSLASDTSSVTLKSSDPLPDGGSPSSATTSPTVSRVPLPELKINPWLAPFDEASQGSVKKKHEVTVYKTSSEADKSKNKLRKRSKKRGEEKEKTKSDSAVNIEMSNVMTLEKGILSTAGATIDSLNFKHKTARIETTACEGDDSDVHSEAEAQEVLASSCKGKGRQSNNIQALQQRELIARAFAGDNVVQVWLLPFII
jgi:U3 small nucleolar RNA-associated protein 14